VLGRHEEKREMSMYRLIEQMTNIQEQIEDIKLQVLKEMIGQRSESQDFGWTHWANRRPIEAIKMVRSQYNMGLRESKRIVDYYRRHQVVPADEYWNQVMTGEIT
jgi:ribosomal protein L7/L12